MPRPPRATVILIWLICVGISFFFPPKISNSRGKKGPLVWNDLNIMSSIFRHATFKRNKSQRFLFSTMQSSERKGKVSLCLGSKLASRELALNFFHFLLSFSLKRHCESPSPHRIRTMGNRARVSRWYEQRGRGWNPNIQVRRKQKSHRWFAFAARPIAGE